jgi:hypothetical protein
VPYPAQRRIVSYSASGAIAMPNAGEDLVVFLNGTSALAMTLADPGKDINGSLLFVAAGGAAAHTVTSASGIGGAGSNYDVLTASGTGTPGLVLLALNGVWVNIGSIAGTLTNVAFAIA